MGYIGQMPGAPQQLPGRETGTGAPPEHSGPRADELPSLLQTRAHSVSLAPQPPSQPVPGPESVPSREPTDGQDEA